MQPMRHGGTSHPWTWCTARGCKVGEHPLCQWLEEKRNLGTFQSKYGSRLWIAFPSLSDRKPQPFETSKQFLYLSSLKNVNKPSKILPSRIFNLGLVSGFWANQFSHFVGDTSPSNISACSFHQFLLGKTQFSTLNSLNA